MSRGHRFTTILADPPWEYSRNRAHDSAGGGTPYLQMDLAALKALSVPSIAERDSALFLWATHPKLPEALELMAAWGFKFTTVAFTWLKLDPKKGGIHSGMGHWTNGNCEIVLLGKRGAPKRQDRDVKQVITAPLMEHSRKPDRVHRDIVRLMGDVPRVELFARRLVPGWTCVGNEVTGNDILADICALRDGRWSEEDARPKMAAQATLFQAA